uniref:Uncharacterized LOC107556470 n=1 Tax=Sinocyclocheilus grahami TaxID=75366 RepID=A0A672KA15_SINGR
MESEIRDVFRHCIRFPVPIFASVVADELVDTANEKHCITILARWSQCDLERGGKLRFSQRWTLLCKHDTIEHVLPSGTSSHIQTELLSCHSPSGTLQAVIREDAGHHMILNPLFTFVKEELFNIKNKQSLILCVCVCLVDDFGSVQLLTIQKDLMVMSCSSPNQPPCLKLGFLSSVDQAEDMQLCNVGGADVYEGFDWQPMLITPPSQEENHQFSGLNFGAILLKPYNLPERRKSPLVVNIHGGPHAHFAADWNATAAALTKLGFAVLMVNYRGSTGFGQDGIESLLGNVGSQDVKDVHRAVLCTLQNEMTLDPDRVAVMGGSHGGFLACHLVGQYPDFYRACAARNPVINAATLLGTSDIVDWRYSSVGIQYAFDRLPTSQSLISMLEKSPIIHAAQIRAPVLLMLGGRDRRVSPHQGLELYRALKSRSTPVRLLWYSDEGHSLSKVNTQSDCFLNIVLWFKEHLN